VVGRSYLAEEKFGGVAFGERTGLWAVLLEIIAGVLLLVALNFRNFATLWTGCVDGAKRSMLPIFSTISEVGYGAVVASVAAFAVVRDSVFDLGAALCGPRSSPCPSPPVSPAPRQAV
jgi:H+/gluconate symporter-like permease